MGGPLVLWKAYLRQNERRPIRTKCITSGCIFILCQVIAQYIKDRKLTSARKVLDYLIWGSVLPLGSHSWQNFIAKHGPQSIFLKIPFDHICYRASVLPIFQIYCKVMEGKSLTSSLQWTKENIVAAEIVAAKLWPAANIFNYTMVPLELRVLYQNFVIFFFVLYLAMLDKKASSGKKGTALNDSSNSAVASPAASAGAGPLKSLLAAVAATLIHSSLTLLPDAIAR